MKTVIREFSKKDKDIFLAMAKRFYAPPAVLHFPSEDVMLSAFQASFDTPEFVKGYMFEYNNEPAGYAIISMKFETEVGGFAAWVEELFVEEKFRSRGIGKNFFDFLTNEFKGKIKRIRLEVGNENEGAKKLYQNLGFEYLDYKQMIIDKNF